MSKNNKLQTATIELAEPITRGEKSHSKIVLRKPMAGELRGVKILDLIQADVNSLMVVLPRITEPALTEADIATLDVADLANMGLEVSGFLGKEKA